MHKKHLVSRSRAYRLLVERLERRSMLAADMEEAFMEEAFFDWSQFDTAEQFDPEAVAFSDFGDQFSGIDENWYSGAGGDEPSPPEQETLLPDSVGDDTAVEATTDFSDITDPTPVDAAPVDAAPVDAAPVDAAPVDAAPVDAAPVDAVPVDPVVIYPPGQDTDFNSALANDADTVETVTPVEPGDDVPVETESPTLELLLPANEAVADLGDHGAADAVDPVDTSYDSGETVSDTTGLDPAETLSAQGDDGDVPGDTASVDDLEPQTGNDGFSEESASTLPDLPVPLAVTSGGSAEAPSSAAAPRTAAFASMGMFANFSFTLQQTDAAEGPTFAGGRRRSRR